MSVEEQFNFMAKHDFEEVRKSLANGNTETSEFLYQLERLSESLDALLQELGGQK